MSEKDDSLKEWTVMFLIAGDNDLAPVFISQLKAIKDAGFQKHVDVLVHFDPSERRTPTKLLHVNRKRRSEANGRPGVGPGNDSYVRNMREDIIEPGEIEAAAETPAGKMREALRRSDKVPAEEALRNFIGFCREKHPAKNYILFLVGHGLVVGNDAFLPDENPKSALTLEKLGTILKEFTDEVKGHGVFQLLALHSCAMSAVEVAYQLRGTAKYMMGSEGISFMGSWPYLNMLMRIFNGQEKADRTAATARAGEDQQAAAAARAANINETIKDLYFHSLFGAKDFMYAGYSHDLALCSLEPERYDPLTGDIKTLAARLKEAVKTDRGRELILIAHWEAQSYWEENYTDLYDFCLCLRRRLPAGDGGELAALGAACEAVIGRLKPQGMAEDKGGPGPVVLFSENFGSRYQYSHGLSVYFPWSKPLDDEPLPPEPVSPQAGGRAPAGAAAGVIKRYEEYAFTKEFGDDSWLSFLELYFEATQRKTRDEEEGRVREKGDGPLPFIESDAHLFGALNKPISSGDKPIASGGAACVCPTIKNYPTRELELEVKDGEKKTVTVKDVFVSESLRGDYESQKD